MRAALLLYLAGDLAPATRDEFDRGLLEDESFAGAVEEAEEDLLEDYAAGTLTGTDHALVQSWIAGSPERSGRAALIAALRSAASQRPRRRHLCVIAEQWPWLLAAAAGIALVAALPMLRRDRPPSPAIATADRPPIVLPTPEAPRPDTILLDALRLRGNDLPFRPQPYRLHPGSPVRIQILVPDDRGEVYSFDLRSTSSRPGSPPIHRDGLRRTGSSAPFYVEVSLPPAALAEGSYVAELRSSAESYRLRFLVARSPDQQP